jgi:hypothetical protein
MMRYGCRVGGWEQIQVMARKLRLQYAGAVYHVMSRGDHLEPVFLADEDRRRESTQDKVARLVAEGGIAGGRLAGTGFGLAAQGRPGEDGAGFAIEAENDHAAQMDLPSAGHGFLEIRQSKIL